MGICSNSLSEIAPREELERTNLHLHVDDVAPHRRVVGRIGRRRHVPLQDRADLDDVFEETEFPERVEVATDGIADGLLARDVVDADARDADVVPYAVVEQVHVEPDVFARSGAADVAVVTGVCLDLHDGLEPVVGRVQADADHLLEGGVALDDLDGLELADFQVAEVVRVLQKETLEPGAFDLYALLSIGGLPFLESSIMTSLDADMSGGRKWLLVARTLSCAGSEHQLQGSSAILLGWPARGWQEFLDCGSSSVPAWPQGFVVCRMRRCALGYGTLLAWNVSLFVAASNL